MRRTVPRALYDWRFPPRATAFPSVLMHTRMPSDPLQSQQARKLISAHVRSPDDAVVPASQPRASSTQPATILDKIIKKQGASRWRSSKLYLACLRAPMATRSARFTNMPIVRNTHTGMTQIPDGIKEAAQSLAMTPTMILRLIE